MNIKNAYKAVYLSTATEGHKLEINGHYRSSFDFGDKDYYVDPDGKPLWNLKFKIGMIKKGKNGKYFHKDVFPVYGKAVNVQPFLFKYVLFLKADGIDDPKLLKYYILKCMVDKCEFWRKKEPDYKEWELYEPEYEDVMGMINRVVEYGAKKFITDDIREVFGYRCNSVINYNRKGSRKTRYEVIMEAGRESKKNRTDKRIREMHNPELTDIENAYICEVSLRRFKMWKKDNVESLEDRLKRLYDPSKSINENMTICGCSKYKIIQWKRMLEENDESKMSDERWVEYMGDKMNDAKECEKNNKIRKDMDEMDDLIAWLDKVDLNKN